MMIPVEINQKYMPFKLADKVDCLYSNFDCKGVLTCFYENMAHALFFYLHDIYEDKELKNIFVIRNIQLGLNHERLEKK